VRTRIEGKIQDHNEGYAEYSMSRCEKLAEMSAGVEGTATYRAHCRKPLGTFVVPTQGPIDAEAVYETQAKKDGTSRLYR